MLELGTPGIVPLASVERQWPRWERLLSKLSKRPFLRSDGLVTTVGPPQRATGELLGRFIELVSRFDAYYRRVVDLCERRPELRAEFMVNPLFDRIIEADKHAKVPLPISRFDAVLTEDGQLRVIELNSVGVCTVHLRAVDYLAHHLRREGLVEDAAILDGFFDELVGAVVRSSPKKNPVVGVLHLPNNSRGVRAAFRHAFEARGVRLVEGTAEQVASNGGEVTLGGTPIDILWGDISLYLGYQFLRYRQTKFVGKFDYATAEEAARKVVQHDGVLSAIAAGRLINLSPGKSYLALPKSLLSFVHRPELELPEDERAWLSSRVARTWSHAERARGVLTRAEVEARREELVLKPGQYGGAHGVMLGEQTSAPDWGRKLSDVWDDPDWVVQQYYRPKRLSDGQWLSVGLYNYGGRLGGVTLRTAADQVISARQSLFIPVVAWPPAR